MANFPTEMVANSGKGDPVLALMSALAIQAGQPRPMEQGLGQALGKRAGMTRYDYDPENLALHQILQQDGPQAVLNAKQRQAPAEAQVLDTFIQVYGPEKGVLAYQDYKNKPAELQAKILGDIEKARIAADAKVKAAGAGLHDMAVAKLLGSLVNNGMIPNDPETLGKMRAIIQATLGEQGPKLGINKQQAPEHGTTAPQSRPSGGVPNDRRPYKTSKGVWTDQSSQNWLGSLGIDIGDAPEAAVVPAQPAQVAMPQAPAVTAPRPQPQAQVTPPPQEATGLFRQHPMLTSPGEQGSNTDIFSLIRDWLAGSDSGAPSTPNPAVGRYRDPFRQ